MLARGVFSWDNGCMRSQAVKTIVSISLITIIAFGGLLTLPRSLMATDLSDAQAQEAALEAQLAALEAEIAQKTTELNNQKGQSASLNNDIKILTTQIDKAKLDIKSKNLVITKLSGEITDKTKTIATLDTKLNHTRDSLAQLMRKTNEIDDATFVHVMLTNESISGFYTDVDTFASIKESVKTSIDNINHVKDETLTEKEALSQKQNQELDAKAQIESAKHKVEVSQNEKEELLSVSKSKEKTYQTILADRQKKAAQIRSALFALRDTSAIPFGDALKYAEIAEKATGIRPAFLLAILTQESNLGVDVGSCYLADKETGAGIKVKSGAAVLKVMKPTRDVAPFIAITTELGRDPMKTRVSCPFSFGYGGAMGPAQFIPSTWMLLKGRISTATGHNPPDPWSPNDAFMASALYLSDLGAAAQTYSAERTAACKYYGGGSSCTSTTAPYGNQVMAKAKKIQETMIDPLEGL